MFECSLVRASYRVLCFVFSVLLSLVLLISYFVLASATAKVLLVAVTGKQTGVNIFKVSGHGLLTKFSTFGFVLKALPLPI